MKTRLAQAVGTQCAADLAGAMFEDTWATVSSLSWGRTVLATTEVDAPEWRGLDRTQIWLQGDGDLGQRMERVLRRALAEAPMAFAVGSDSPGLPVPLLESAREALKISDAVLGPSADGGFYLLGLGICPEGILDGIAWSAADTCQRTRERLLAGGLRTTLIEPWFDVDTPTDLSRLSRMLERGEILAPRTRACLRSFLAS